MGLMFLIIILLQTNLVKFDSVFSILYAFKGNYFPKLYQLCFSSELLIFFSPKKKNEHRLFSMSTIGRYN